MMVKKTTSNLTSGSRIIIGGIGGITPIIVSLLVVDIESVIHDIGLMDVVGFSVRTLVLVFIGALVAYLHNSESEPFKIFQLGIAAPALLSTAINGYGVVGGMNIKEMKTAAIETDKTWSFVIIPSAHAAKINASYSYKYLNSNSFQEPKISNFERFLRGLIGRKVASKGDDWFVIVGSHRNSEKAFKHVKRLKKKHYLAKVYQPTNGSKYYAVIIGANLDLVEANKLRDTAIHKGLAKDAYLWRR